jgi:hypothetical protein
MIPKVINYCWFGGALARECQIKHRFMEKILS